MVQTPTDEIVAELRRKWSDWQIWLVPRVYAGPIWCARRFDDHRNVLNAEGPEELEEQLRSNE